MAFKLGLDAKRAFNNHSGLGVYSRSLIEYLEKNIPHQNIILFTPKKKLWTTNLTTVTSRLGSLWRSFSIYYDLIKHKIDIYHGLAGELPFFMPKKVKTIVTIHDLLFLHFPDDYPWIDRVIYNFKSKSASKRADKIIAVSDTTKKDIIQYYHVAPEKIVVIHPAIPELPEIAQIRPLSNDYIVCISSFLGRKNQDILICAFDKIASQVSFDLIFIGSGKRLNLVKELAIKSNYSDRIHFLTNLNDSEKFCYLKHCLFSVYPSLGEGFGIPILESFSLNKPIILSDTPIHREVADEAGIYFESNNAIDLADKMINIYHTKVNENLISAKKRIHKYDNEKTYKALIALYVKLMD